MGGSHADVSKHVKSYMGVFAALFIFTIITVAVSTVDMGHTINVIVALLIASFKASLVAAIFMHLKWESSGIIWITLVFCAIFFVVLMLIPLWADNGFPAGTIPSSWG